MTDWFIDNKLSLHLSMTDWFIDNKLSLHLSKTECMLFGPPRKIKQIYRNAKCLDTRSRMTYNCTISVLFGLLLFIMEL